MTTTASTPADDGDGDAPGDLGAQIVEILLEAHEDYSGGQRQVRSKTQRVYGQIFADLPDRLCVGLGAKRSDVTMRKVGRAGYKVPVVGDALYFAWRPRGGAKPEDVTFGGSTTREGLWRVRRDTDALPFDEDDGLALDRPTADEVTASAAEVLETDDSVRVVIVAMTSTAHRMDRIEWGAATLGPDGKLVWDPELLFDGATRPSPASAGAAAFDSGSAPKPVVSPKARPKDEGEEQAGSDPNA